MARVLSLLISYFSNYYTLHRSDLAARAAPLDPRLKYIVWYKLVIYFVVIKKRDLYIFFFISLTALDSRAPLLPTVIFKEAVSTTVKKKATQKGSVLFERVYQICHKNVKKIKPRRIEGDPSQQFPYSQNTASPKYKLY